MAHPVGTMLQKKGVIVAFILFILLIALAFLYFQKVKQIEELDEELSETYAALSEIKEELDNLKDEGVTWAEDLLGRLHHELNLFGYTNGGVEEPRSREAFAKEMRERVR